MIEYLFEDTDIATTIFMDEGSNTSFITTKLAEDLNLEGELKPTKFFKAGEEEARPVPYKHHVIELKDREGKAYKIKCIEVPFITSVEKRPNLEKILHLFPSLPKDSFRRPIKEVGVGQNAIAYFLLEVQDYLELRVWE